MEEEDISEENLEKQNFLRENILEKGYDVNEFISFVIGKKGEGGDDVSNWTLPDLKDAVKEFIELNQNIQSSEGKKIEKKVDKKDEHKNEKKDKKKSEEKNDEKNLVKGEEANNEIDLNHNIKKDGLINYGVTKIKKINCQKIFSLNNLDNCENLKISVQYFEKVEGKLFSKSYVNYLITTMPLNFKVKRRFSDFVWLRQTIMNCYSYCLIPPIPSKNKLGDQFEESFLRKRARGLEKFLNFLLIHPILKNLKVVYEFLSLDKDEEFQKAKKSHEKIKIPSKASEFASVDGTAIIEMNYQKIDTVKKIKEISSFYENNLEKINSTMTSLKVDLLSVCMKIKDLSECMKIMKKKSIEYSEEDGVIIAYDELISIFQNLYLCMTRQNHVISVNIREYFKFLKSNYDSMKELLHIGNNMKTSFQKSFKNLITKKEDYYKKGEIAKWEFNPTEDIDKTAILKDKNLAMEKMFYKDTLEVIRQKEIYGFYLNSIISEHERMKKVMSKEHIKLVSTILEKMNLTIKEYMKSLDENNKTLKEPNKDIKIEQKENAQNDNFNDSNKEEENIEHIDNDTPTKNEEN